MPVLAQVAALVAAALHVLFFALESVLFARPHVWRRFGLTTQAQADVVRPMALNQGFYNLFLATGIVVGLVLVWSGSTTAGTAVVAFGCACILGAGVVLAASNPRLLRAALIQGVPPLVALLAIAL